MFKLVLACALVASAFGDVSHLFQRPRGFAPLPVPAYHSIAGFAPVVKSHSARDAAILRQSSDLSPEGSYQWAYETENGISAQEQASVRALGPEQVDKSAQGSFSWTSPEGEQVSVSYVADANGYQPQGSHIPVAPPVPEAIQRALAYIAAHPHQEYQPTGFSGQRRF